MRAVRHDVVAGGRVARASGLAKAGRRIRSRLVAARRSRAARGARARPRPRAESSAGGRGDRVAVVRGSRRRRGRSARGEVGLELGPRGGGAAAGRRRPSRSSTSCASRTSVAPSRISCVRPRGDRACRPARDGADVAAELERAVGGDEACPSAPPPRPRRRRSRARPSAGCEPGSRCRCTGPAGSLGDHRAALARSGVEAAVARRVDDVRPAREDRDVCPPPARAPRARRASIPIAIPLTTTTPASASSPASSWRRAARSALGRRVPTIVTALRRVEAGDRTPRSPSPWSRAPSASPRSTQLPRVARDRPARGSQAHRCARAAPPQRRAPRRGASASTALARRRDRRSCARRAAARSWPRPLSPEPAAGDRRERARSSGGRSERVSAAVISALRARAEPLGLTLRGPRARARGPPPTPRPAAPRERSATGCSTPRARCRSGRRARRSASRS